jgi:hypothetical protein
MTGLQARDLNAEPLSKTAKGERANLLEGLETAGHRSDPPPAESGTQTV